MLKERIEYWKNQINLFGKQSIYHSDIELIEKTLKEKEEEIEKLQGHAVDHYINELRRKLREKDEKIKQLEEDLESEIELHEMTQEQLTAELEHSSNMLDEEN